MISLLWWVGLGLLVLFLGYNIYAYGLHLKEVRRVQHIPGYSFYSFYSMLLFAPDQNFMFKPRLQALNAKKFGKENIWRITVGTNTICFTVNPETYKEVLVTKAKSFRKHPLFNNINLDYLVKSVFTDYGDSWKRQRQLVQPSFSDDNLANILVDHMHFISHKLSEKLWELKDENNTINIGNIMSRTTLEVIARAGFGLSDLDIIGGTDGRFATLAGSVIQVLSAGLVFNRRVIEPVTKLLFPDKFKQVFVEWPNLLRSAVSKREHEIELEKESGEVYKSNLLSNMLLSKVEDDSVKNKSFSLEVVANTHIFLLAGFETTLQTLTWLFYFISKDQERQEKLRQELISTISDDAGLEFTTYDDKTKLTYAKNIINETLRLKGPAHTNSRYAMKKVEIAGVTIPKGVSVEMKFCVSQTDPEVWGSDSFEFVPERFERPEISEALKNNRYLLIPFSIGPRTCVGLKFAEMEIIDILYHVLKNYRLECVTEGEIGETADVTMKPARDIFLRLHKI